MFYAMMAEIARMQREERMREAERFRRAAEARSMPAAGRPAPERRFVFFRAFFSRPREA
jgi:hypothetical protein